MLWFVKNSEQSISNESRVKGYFKKYYPGELLPNGPLWINPEAGGPCNRGN